MLSLSGLCHDIGATHSVECEATLASFRNGCDAPSAYWADPPTWASTVGVSSNSSSESTVGVSSNSSSEMELESRLVSVNSSLEHIGGEAWYEVVLEVDVTIGARGKAWCAPGSTADLVVQMTHQSLAMRFYATGGELSEELAQATASSIRWQKDDGLLVVRLDAARRWWSHHDSLFVDLTVLRRLSTMTDWAC